MATAAPEILWAQRSSEDDAEQCVVMLTINAPNLPPAPATKLDLTPTGFTFDAKVPENKELGIEPKHYAFKLDFFEEIDVEKSKQHLTGKALYLVLQKKETKLEYWPRLSKDKVRYHNIKTDFDKWVDEDEQNEFDDGGMGGFGGMDPSMMAGMGGMGGMGGMPGMGGMGGGMGGMDIQEMLKSMGGDAGGMGDFEAGADDDDDDDAPASAGAAGAAGGAAEATGADAGAKSEEAVTSTKTAKDIESID